MNKLKPTGAQIIIKEYKDVQQSLVLPDKMKGQLFEVLDVGRGWYTDDGKLIPLEIKPGDIVAIIGKMFTIPFQGNRFLIAREADVIAYFRENVGIKNN